MEKIVEKIAKEIKDQIPASAIKYEKGYDFVKGDYFKLIERW